MINLLSEKKNKFDKRLQLAVKVKTWSGIILVGYIAVMVLTVIVNQVYVMRIDGTRKALDAARLKLTSKVLLIDQYNSVINRAAVIKTLLAERRESISLWNTVRGMLPETVELTRFGLDDAGLSLGFSAPSVLLANQMLEIIETQFDQINAQETEVGILRSDDASYSINAEVVLP
jgi:hypothetical protein